MLKISIVTPSYQQAPFIERTIQSILAQDWPLTEHIVVDGGSTDGTVDILRRYDRQLAHWVSEPDRGQSHAVNKGVARATGDLIGWINSDDVYLPGAFQAVAEHFDRHPEVDACYGGLAVIDAEDRVIDAYWPPRVDVRVTLAIGLNIYGQALFVRRSVWEKLGGIDEKLHMAMDYDFIVRLMLEHKLGRIERYLGALRMHDATKTGRAKSDPSAVGQREIAELRRRYAARAGLDSSMLLSRARLQVRRITSQIAGTGPRYVAFKLVKRAGLALPRLAGLPDRLSIAV